MTASAAAAPGDLARAGTPGRNDRRTVTVVSAAHACSHFFHLIIAPLFPWLKAEFGVSYAELGLLMTVFFVVSGVGQALAGFVVDRIGPVPVLLASLCAFVASALVLSMAPGYAMLVVGCTLAGLGNAAFHPVDYSILNARIAPARLARAYAVHSVAGNLGWALAPVFLVGITGLAGWRVAVGAVALPAAGLLVLVWTHRALLAGAPVGMLGTVRAAPRAAAAARTEHSLAFMRLPAVWLSFLFFLTLAISFGGIQSFGSEAARQLHGVAPSWAAMCLTVYMLSSAVGTLAGGWAAGDPSRAESIVAGGYALAAAVSLALALLDTPAWIVPMLFGLMGFGSGTAGPARDLLVRRASPPGATGRVYGLVYSGLDAGMALAPAAFGWMMDHGMPAAVWLGIAFFQALLIANAMGVGRAADRRAAAPSGAPH
jgi:FSR family fosmidomycin resistance protein-like MFS transporter